MHLYISLVLQFSLHAQICLIISSSLHSPLGFRTISKPNRTTCAAWDFAGCFVEVSQGFFLNAKNGHEMMDISWRLHRVRTEDVIGMSWDYTRLYGVTEATNWSLCKLEMNLSKDVLKRKRSRGISDEIRIDVVKSCTSSLRLGYAYKSLWVLVSLPQACPLVI